jgi:hypothetical protein
MAATLALSGGVQAQVVNGSFETPAVTPGTFTLFSAGGSGFSGWGVVGPSGTNVAIVSGTFAQNGVTFEAQAGNQWLDLTGDNSNSSEGVSQTVATTAGHLYEVTFYVGNTTGGGIFGSSSTVRLSVNGVAALSAVNSMVNATGLSWQQFTYDFTAGGASTTLAFVNGDPASDNSNGLDNVALVDRGIAAVPEPDTYALMLAGLAALGVGVRRRRDASPG